MSIVPVTQLDRIEAKLDKLLALLEKPKRAVRKAKDEESSYPEEFEKTWQIYPKRAGTNSKRNAYRAWKTRIRVGRGVGAGPAELHDGVERYAAFCKATGKIGTEYVMMASTFFGVHGHWLTDWAIPEQATQPKTDDEWIAYGRQLGKEPWPGESMAAYKQRLTGEKR